MKLSRNKQCACDAPPKRNALRSIEVLQQFQLYVRVYALCVCVCVCVCVRVHVCVCLCTGLHNCAYFHEELVTSASFCPAHRSMTCSQRPRHTASVRELAPFRVLLPGRSAVREWLRVALDDGLAGQVGAVDGGVAVIQLPSSAHVGGVNQASDGHLQASTWCGFDPCVWSRCKLIR